MTVPDADENVAKVSVNSLSDSPTGSPDSSTGDVVDEVSDESGSLKSLDEVAREVIAGHWGRGHLRYRRLEAAGYDADAVQRTVTRMFHESS